LDTIDLYQARARSLFAQSAAKLCSVSEQQVSADLLQLIEKLEAARLVMRKNGDDQNHNEAPMTPTERDAALSYLKDPKLTERIVEDFRKCGLVGERATVLTAYLAAVSRKLSEPLAVLIVARSGAGKSALQDALCAFVPLPGSPALLTGRCPCCAFEPRCPLRQPRCARERPARRTVEDRESACLFAERLLAETAP
jgi:hypothetical protein